MGSRYRILTEDLSSPKQEKQATYNGKPIVGALLYLSPANASGYEVCTGRTKGCSVACLGFTGHGGIGVKREVDRVLGTNSVQEARKRRTLGFFERRADFLSGIVRDVAKLVTLADATGRVPSARLNGTSDLDWLSVSVVRDGAEYPSMMAAYPEVQWYDYTKRRGVVASADLPANYSVTFSRAETLANKIEAMRVLRDGGNVATVFSTKKGQPLPHEWNGFRVIDGDLHDYRWLDPKNVIVGLRQKGNKRDTSGFVVQV